MPRLRYPIQPLQHGLASDYPSLYIEAGYSPSALNVKILQHSVQKRWGYALDRAIGEPVYNVILYQLADGNRFTAYLTDKNACVKKTGSGETFSYITGTYTTGTVTDIVADTVTGLGTDWVTTGGVAVGDKFILDDDHSANIEPDANWATVKTVAATTIVLDASYTGTTGTGMSKTYKIRKVYSLPNHERWNYAFVNDTLCFTNGNIPMQTWSGSGYSTAVDEAEASKARYCIEYANRLFLADLDNSAVRNPYLIRWSKEGDPTNWTDTTAGEIPLIQTDDYITGLGKVGGNIVVYKQKSLLIGNRTGRPTDCVEFPTTRPGIGNIAPYSILDVIGANFWLGRDDFYVMDSDYPTPIGEKMRFKFFDVIDPTQAEKTWGFVNYHQNECVWIATATTGGQYAFVYDYKVKEWMMYQYADEIVGAGTGAI